MGNALEPWVTRKLRGDAWIDFVAASAALLGGLLVLVISYLCDVWRDVVCAGVSVACSKCGVVGQDHSRCGGRVVVCGELAGSAVAV